eukprot:Partr_v1_DN27804_c1_g1_i3_m22595 putative serine threonine protein kinase
MPSFPPSDVHPPIPRNVRLVQMNGQLYFGRFKLGQTLGEGEFGKVKLALAVSAGHVDRAPSTEFAIKFVRKNILNSSHNRRDKLEREISIMRELPSHPSIIKLHEVLESDKYFGLVMDYASGGELFNHILAKKHLSTKESQKFFLQLIDGVKFLHSHRIAHRDLKLENLLLDSRGNVKITDFGFSNRQSSSSNLMKTSCGSPCYAAPELVLSDAYDGFAADVWSCGVILYAMVCGYLPYDDDPMNPESANVHLLYKYILKSRLKFPSWVDERACDLATKMLAINPESRLKIVDILQHNWCAELVASNSLSSEVTPRDQVFTPLMRDRASSAPSTSAKMPVSMRSAFEKNDGNFSVGPLLNFRTRPAVRFSPRNETISEEADSAFLPLSPSTPSSIRSPVVTSLVNSSESSLPSLSISIKDDRSLSNADSVNSVDDACISPDIKVHRGAIDPRFVSTTVPPPVMIDEALRKLTFKSEQPSLAGAHINLELFGGFLTISRISPTYLECSWRPSGDHIDNLSADKENVHDVSEGITNLETIKQGRRNSVGAQLIRSLKVSQSRLKQFWSSRTTKEIKFSIQVCKVNNLDGVHCIDIRRLRGDNRSYRNIYSELVAVFDTL